MSKKEKSKPINKIKFGFDELFTSPSINKYQRDLSKAILGDKKYTFDEAKAILERYFNKK